MTLPIRLAGDDGASVVRVGAWFRHHVQAIAAWLRTATTAAKAPLEASFDRPNGDDADALFLARRERLRRHEIILYRTDPRDGKIKYVLTRGNEARCSTPTRRGMKYAEWSLGAPRGEEHLELGAAAHEEISQ